MHVRPIICIGRAFTGRSGHEHSPCIPRAAGHEYYTSIKRTRVYSSCLALTPIYHITPVPLPLRSHPCDGVQYWSGGSARTGRARRSMPRSLACLHASCGRCEQQPPLSPLPRLPRFPPIKRGAGRPHGSSRWGISGTRIQLAQQGHYRAEHQEDDTRAVKREGLCPFT